MSNNESKAILYVILSIIICFFCFMKNTGDIQNKIFKNECFNCKEYNYSDYEKLSDSPLYSLNNKNIKNVNLTYTRFFSKYGKITINYMEKREDGIWVLKKGTSSGLNPEDISWSIFNTFHLKFKNNLLILEADDNFFKSNQKIFLMGTEEAFLNSRKESKKG